MTCFKNSLFQSKQHKDSSDAAEPGAGDLETNPSNPRERLKKKINFIYKDEMVSCPFLFVSTYGTYTNLHF